MGSIVELNDTLQITREQGFPSELDFDTHRINPLTAESFKGRVFTFRNKPGIRVYQRLPVRVFLVENRGGKWLYWGLIHILKVTHDYVNETSLGKFKIVYLYTLEEMKLAHQLIDRDPDTDFFS